MPIDIFFVHESGDEQYQVEDPTCVLERLLPEFGDERFVYLHDIDPYGLTFFNKLQAPKVLREWELLHARVRTEEGARVFDSVRRLLERLGSAPNFYVKFVGD